MFPFPFMFFIDCKGDMWVPCHCPASNGASGAEPPAAGSEVLPMPINSSSCNQERNRTVITKTIVDGKLVKTEIVEGADTVHEDGFDEAYMGD